MPAEKKRKNIVVVACCWCYGGCAVVGRPLRLSSLWRCVVVVKLVSKGYIIGPAGGY